MQRQKAECFFWYQPTRFVPEQRPLNGCCCCCTSRPGSPRKYASSAAQQQFDEQVYAPGTRSVCSLCRYHPSSTYRLRRVHETQTIVADVCGVCLSVCHAVQRGFAVQKRLNRSRSCLGWTQLGDKEHCDRWGSWSPHREGRGIQCSLRQITLLLVFFCLISLGRLIVGIVE